MTPRPVSYVAPAHRTVEGGGFVVRRPFPVPGLDLVDPFLLLDEMGPVEYAPGKAVGAPDHPHRGFETVTYLLDGEMHHEDSAGNAGFLKAGDVQWMTAGAGVVHSEEPSAEMRENGGRMHGFQLWVNLPRQDKMIAPRYQDTPSARIPVVERDGVRVKVIAGEALGAKAVIDTRTPILYWHVTLAPGASVDLPVPADHAVFAYVFKGGAAFAGRDVKDGQMARFAQDGDGIAATAGADGADFLVIGGVPLKEPVARYGPFVMNYPAEIRQAFEDFQAGRLGRIQRR